MQLIVISLKEEFYNKVSFILFKIINQSNGISLRLMVSWVSILFLPTALSLE